MDKNDSHVTSLGEIEFRVSGGRNQVDVFSTFIQSVNSWGEVEALRVIDTRRGPGLEGEVFIDGIVVRTN